MAGDAWDRVGPRADCAIADSSSTASAAARTVLARAAWNCACQHLFPKTRRKTREHAEWRQAFAFRRFSSSLFCFSFFLFFLSLFVARQPSNSIGSLSLSLSLRFSPLVFRYSSRFSFTSVFLVGDRICFLFYPVIYLMFRHESLFDPCSVSLQKKEIHRREIILFEPLLISRQKYLSKMRERSGSIAFNRNRGQGIVNHPYSGFHLAAISLQAVHNTRGALYTEPLLHLVAAEAEERSGNRKYFTPPSSRRFV